eukprot:s2225_g12.t1
MSKQAQDMAGLRCFLTELLEDETEGGQLIAKAQEAVPGEAQTSKKRWNDKTQQAITVPQRRWLESHVRGRWSSLGQDQKEHYMKRAADKASKRIKKETCDQPPMQPEAASASDGRFGYRPLTETTSKQRTRHTTELVEFLSKFATAEDVSEIIGNAIQKLSDKFPQLQELVLQQCAQTEPSLECTRCGDMLQALHQTPGFSAPFPDPKTAAIRDHVDRAVVDIFAELDAVQRAGYKIGVKRWRQASQEDKSERKPRGRPSKKDSPEVIQNLLSLLSANSQDSSRLCFDPAKEEWVQVKTLTRDITSMWHENADSLGGISINTMRRCMKLHLSHFKPAWTESDMCIYCVDLRQKILPRSQRLISKIREKLAELLPSYFEQFDIYSLNSGLKDRPGLELRELRHFLLHHGEARPCRKHNGSSFPCGLSRLRQRAAGFPQRLRVDLHALEAEAALKLQAMSKLMDGYLFHRSANEHQKPILFQLLENPRPKHLTILSDWKELFTLPVRSVQTGEEFYANSRMEISIWGSVLSERASDESDEVLVTHVLILSTILDHTSARSCQCLNMALDQRRGRSKLQVIDVVSDSGPHYRAYENMWFNCIKLPVQRQCEIRTHWGVEKHMKSAADSLFGLFAKYMTIAKSRRVDIVEIADLKKFLVQINAEQRARDPTAPHLVVLVDTDSTKVPSTERHKLKATGFSITKSYCISSVPTAQRGWRFGVRVFNHVFSSMQTAVELTTDLQLLPADDTAEHYRHGFWTQSGKERWNTNPKPLGRNESNILSKRMEKHEALLPEGADATFGSIDLQSLIDRKKKSIEKRKQRLDRKRTLQNAAESSSCSTDSSSDTSDSSD